MRKPTEKLGVLGFRKCVDHPLGWFNQEIRISEERSPAKLRTIRMHMVNSEVAHWAGFAAMLALMFVAWRYRGPKIAAAYLICNVLGNLYPCLLQQYNKRRIMRVIEIAGSRKARNASSDDRERRTASSHASPTRGIEIDLPQLRSKSVRQDSPRRDRNHRFVSSKSGSLDQHGNLRLESESGKIHLHLPEGPDNFIDCTVRPFFGFSEISAPSARGRLPKPRIGCDGPEDCEGAA